MHRYSLCTFLCLSLGLLSGPAIAQEIDFGDDSSRYSNDGECDDPRFEGAGMTTTTLLDSDRFADATDCRAAFDAGQLSLIAGEMAMRDSDGGGGSGDPKPAAGLNTGIDFGADTSLYAQDGECDDPRFEGTGMASPPLLDRDRMADATDCRAAFDAGTISLAAGSDETPPLSDSSAVDFGDDSSIYSNDGECDDPRFEGAGMTSTPLLDSDRMADATDCRTAFEAGLITVIGGATDGDSGGGLVIDGIDFGSDSGNYTNDGECDDPRFEGDGMANPPLLDSDRMADATDCVTAYQDGLIALADDTPQEPIVIDGIDFGTDSGSYTLDNECDDPRFYGPGMAQPPHLDENRFGDATDCSREYSNGLVALEGMDLVPPEHVMADGIDFGLDSGNYTNDGECDDPRFQGQGMASPPLLDSDRLADATDCLEAYQAGEIVLVSPGGGDGEALVEFGIDFGTDSGSYANDGECDDPRFAGPGMAGPPLLDSDIRADASDCYEAYLEGDIRLASEVGPQGPNQRIGGSRR